MDPADSVRRPKGTVLPLVVPVVADPVDLVRRLVVLAALKGTVLPVVVPVVAGRAGAGRVVLAGLPRAWVIRPRSAT